MSITLSLSFAGITGWILKMFPVLLYGPMPKLLLFCSGTLIRLATGFCVALANAAVLSAAEAVDDADAFAPGVSCAATDKPAPAIANATHNRRHRGLSNIKMPLIVRLASHHLSPSERLNVT